MKTDKIFSFDCSFSSINKNNAAFFHLMLVFYKNVGTPIANTFFILFISVIRGSGPCYS